MQKVAENNNKVKFPKAVKIILCVVAAVYLVTFIFSMLLHKVWSYQPGEEAIKAMAGSDSVEIIRVHRGYLFDGPGTDKAIIFYPGALVEFEAYAPLMLRLSEEGYDCFLTRLPYNMAFFSLDRGDYYLENYKDQYSSWYVCGHSLGGAMAASFVNKHPEDIDEMIFLASYPTQSFLNEDIKVLSLYGELDGVLNFEKIVSGREFMPAKYVEVPIPGGNHANFGDYGHQKKDKEATISASEQVEITVNQIKLMDENGELR